MTNPYRICYQTPSSVALAAFHSAPSPERKFFQRLIVAETFEEHNKALVDWEHLITVSMEKRLWPHTVVALTSFAYTQWTYSSFIESELENTLQFSQPDNSNQACSIWIVLNCKSCGFSNYTTITTEVCLMRFSDFFPLCALFHFFPPRSRRSFFKWKQTLKLPPPLTET